MFSFFDWIVAFAENVGDYLINTINSIANILSLIVEMTSFPFRIQGFLPPVIATCILVVCSVGIAKLIVGWGNS